METRTQTCGPLVNFDPYPIDKALHSTTRSRTNNARSFRPGPRDPTWLMFNAKPRILKGCQNRGTCKMVVFLLVSLCINLTRVPPQNCSATIVLVKGKSATWYQALQKLRRVQIPWGPFQVALLPGRTNFQRKGSFSGFHLQGSTGCGVFFFVCTACWLVVLKDNRAQIPRNKSREAIFPSLFPFNRIPVWGTHF